MSIKRVLFHGFLAEQLDFRGVVQVQFCLILVFIRVVRMFRIATGYVVLLL